MLIEQLKVGQMVASFIPADTRVFGPRSLGIPSRTRCWRSRSAAAIR